MISAYLTSLLARQYLALDRAGFLERHPHCWLAWEPGTWVAPPAASGASQETRLPDAQVARAPLTGQALCFELKPKGSDLVLGRNAESDICISDATVSRRHLGLAFKDQRWQGQAVSAAGPVSVSGVPLGVDGWRTLVSQQKLSLGGVSLTFLAASDLMARVRTEAEALSQSRRIAQGPQV